MGRGGCGGEAGFRPGGGRAGGWAARRQGGGYRVDGYRQPRRDENRYRLKHRAPMTRPRMRPIMKALRVVFHLGLLIGSGIEITGVAATAQTAPPKGAQAPA